MLLVILHMKVCANNYHKAAKTYAFLDPSSTASFCTESLLSKLKVTGSDVQLLPTGLASCC